MNDRIRIAEARGYRRVRPDADHWYFPPGSTPPEGATIGLRGLPDPFHDANADYAVLEWMRALEETGMRDDYDAWIKYANLLPPIPSYQIGDYARAALKVIE